MGNTDPGYVLASAGGGWGAGYEVVRAAGGSGLPPPPPQSAHPYWSNDRAGEAEKPSFQISVYLDDGQVFDYTVHSMAAAREHSSAIVVTGYRSVSAEDPNVLVHFPPHRIKKVKVVGSSSFSTQYHDRVRGT